MNMKYTALALIVLAHSPKAFAISENETSDGFASQVIYAENHAGQTDTDGILSPGERKNPNIDYDNAQRQGEDRGDSRYENSENNEAAHVDRHYKNEDRAQFGGDSNLRDRGRDVRDESDHQHNHQQEERRDNGSWWNW